MQLETAAAQTSMMGLEFEHMIRGLRQGNLI
jgi:hypothetical protein